MSSQDLLNCGNCKISFSLDNITLFLQHKISGCQQVKEEIQNERISRINSQTEFEKNNVATSTTKDGMESLLQPNTRGFIYFSSAFRASRLHLSSVQ